MKRKMLLLTLALPVMLCQSVNAQTASRLVGQADWVNDGVSFQYSDSTHYNYSSGRGGDLTHEMKYDNATMWTYDTGTYSNSWYYIQRFDGNNNDTSHITEFWNSGTSSWVPYSNTLTFYNGSNQRTQMVMQSWGGSSWFPISRDMYSYDLAGRLIVDLFQIYIGGTYINSSQRTYYYDPITNNLVNETDQSYVSSTWVYTNAWDYTYTTTNQILTVTAKTWGGSWWNWSSRYTNTYNTGGDMTYRMLQSYSMVDSTWHNDSLHIFSGFVGTNPTYDIVQQYDTAWENVIQFTNTYNSWGQLTSSSGQSWNILTPVFEYQLGDPRHNYYYETYNPAVASVKNVSSAGGDATVYPVPAQSTLHVDLKWDIAQAADLTICDVTGKVVRYWTTPESTQYATTVSVDNLSQGTYFLRISGTQGQIVKQLVVTH